jgi:serine/threonine-protein kinase
MGAVYVVEQISTGKPRALKLMLPDFVADPTSRKRFAQEAQIASRIESEHVVEVVGSGIDPASGSPWLAMELLVGHNLAEILEQRTRLPPAEVLAIFQQLCHALGAAHRARIVHRDLKPENLFLAQSQRAGETAIVKVLDFGIAKIVAEAETKHTGQVGSPMWMAPEQTEHSGITPATDVWALGLVAFNLLTGRYFWKAANLEETTIPQLLREVLFEPLPSASIRAKELGCEEHIPATFDEWFSRCVNRDPKARFGDASRALGPLRRALVHVEIASAMPALAPNRLGHAQRPAVTSVRFVGRKEELRRIGGVLAAATKHSARVITIRGGNGVGKTRLLYEVGRRLRKGGYNVGFHIASCPERGNDFPLSGIVSMVQVLCGTNEGDVNDRILVLRSRLSAHGLSADEITAVLTVAGANVASAPGKVNTLLSQAFGQMVQSLCQERPHVFAWDVAHALDNESFALLDELLRRLRASRLVFVFAARADFSHPLERTPGHAGIDLG